MRRLILMMFAFVLLQFAVLQAQADGALPSVLPEKAGKSFSGVLKTVVLETTAGKCVTCTSGTLSGSEETGKPLGAFHIALKGCSTIAAAIKVVCTGLGDMTGEILVLGVWHLVGLAGSGAPAVLFLVNSTHFECASGIVLQLIAGSVLCPVVEPGKVGATHEFACQQSAGKQVQTTYVNDAKEEVTAALESTEGEGAKIGAGLEETGSTITYSEAIEIMAP